MTALPVALALALTGCSTGDLFGSPSTTSGTGTSSGPSEQARRQLPASIGKGLKYAVDAARTAGFSHLTTHDASGRMRAQILHNDWRVCFQTPGPALLPVDTRVDFGVVKLAEPCPSADQGLITVTAGALMPELRGRSARYAFDVLGGNASIRYLNRSGGNAIVLVDSNWEVCGQSPAPGQPYGGVPVTLTVAKYTDGGCRKQ